MTWPALETHSLHGHVALPPECCVANGRKAYGFEQPSSQQLVWTSSPGPGFGVVDQHLQPGVREGVYGMSDGARSPSKLPCFLEFTSLWSVGTLCPRSTGEGPPSVSGFRGVCNVAAGSVKAWKARRPHKHCACTRPLHPLRNVAVEVMAHHDCHSPLMGSKGRKPANSRKRRCSKAEPGYYVSLQEKSRCRCLELARGRCRASLGPSRRGFGCLRENRSA